MPVNKAAEDLLAASLRLTAAMASEENVDALLGRGLELCARVLDCERALIISEQVPNSPVVLRSVGAGDQPNAFSGTALRLVAEKGEPLLISDTIDDEVLSVQESINRNDIRSVLCARLERVQAERNAASIFLYLDSRTDRHPFSHNDLEKFRLLSLLMANLVQKSDLLAEREAAIEELRSQVEERRFEDLIFGSDSFQKCATAIRQAAPTGVPVLLLGETGAGKELLARTVHKLSARGGKPFLTVNCGAIPANLIESYLFGHERGAFTGAVGARKGYFEEADGGTLFLDEIGELPPSMQTHFLRVLQEGEIVRVGSTRPIAVDVRIVAATNVDLEEAVRNGAFRKDLFYRLSVFPVRVPPVRERGEDALLLARFFLRRYAESYGRKTVKLSREAEKAILVYEWPGNVREIQNRIQRAMITAAGQNLTSNDLGLEQGGPAAASSLREAREAVDREMIGRALERAPGNLTKAGRILGIDRKSLRILLEKYGISA